MLETISLASVPDSRQVCRVTLVEGVPTGKCTARTLALGPENAAVAFYDVGATREEAVARATARAESMFGAKVQELLH